jgi:hypothetical protein
VRLEGLGISKKTNELIGNRTRNLVSTLRKSDVNVALLTNASYAHIGPCGNIFSGR